MKQKPMWNDAALHQLKHAVDYLVTISKKEQCPSMFKHSFAMALLNTKYHARSRRFGRYYITKLNVGSVF